PHDAKTITAETYARLRELAREPEVVGLGETGLDFYYDNSPREDQRTHFRAFIRLARELGLPLSMHVREAYGEAAETLRSEGAGEGGGARRVFTGGAEEARALLGLALFLSFRGIATSKNAPALREAARAAPLERLLIKPASPLLARVPSRGKRNKPAYVVQV